MLTVHGLKTSSLKVMLDLLSKLIHLGFTTLMLLIIDEIAALEPWCNIIIIIMTKRKGTQEQKNFSGPFKPLRMLHCLHY